MSLFEMRDMRALRGECQPELELDGMSFNLPYELGHGGGVYKRK
jgi:hypothetical protein